MHHMPKLYPTYAIDPSLVWHWATPTSYQLITSQQPLGCNLYLYSFLFHQSADARHRRGIHRSSIPGRGCTYVPLVSSYHKITNASASGNWRSNSSRIWGRKARMEGEALVVDPHVQCAYLIFRLCYLPRESPLLIHDRNPREPNSPTLRHPTPSQSLKPIHPPGHVAKVHPKRSKRIPYLLSRWRSQFTIMSNFRLIPWHRGGAVAPGRQC